MDKFLAEMHEAKTPEQCGSVLVHVIEHLTRSDNKDIGYILSLYKSKMSDYRRAAFLDQERRDDLGSDS
jgi:hypothetical protein